MSCGRTIPPAQYLLEESGIIPPASPAPIEAPRPVRRGPTDISSYRTATLGDRFVAFALDCAFLFGVFAVIDAWVFMRWGIIDGAELRLTLAAIIIAEFLNVAILFLYLWLLEAGFGATLGKAMVGIRVVRTADHSRLAAFAIRNVLRLVDGLGFYLVGAVLAGCSRIHRRLGDICAGTAVIEERFGYGAKVSAIVLWMAVLAGAIWAVPRICNTNAALPTRYLNQVVVRVGRGEKSAYLKIAGLQVEVQVASGSAR